MKKILLLFACLILVLSLFTACLSPDDGPDVEENFAPETELKDLTEEELIDFFEVAYGGYDVVDAPEEERIQLELKLLHDMMYVSGSRLPDDYEELYRQWRPTE